jgi:hypothetical protein
MLADIVKPEVLDTFLFGLKENREETTRRKQLEKKEEGGDIEMLKDIREHEGLSQSFANIICSMLLSGDKIVLAFDDGIGGPQSSDVLSILMELDN